ncbi:MAG: PleD family two-component system response regulator [Kofleriaceae bacterium]
MSTVLIADESDADRQFIANRAGKLGMQCELATNGKDALEIARRSLPRVMVVGTEVGGIRISATLRGSPETRNIHIVLVSPEDQLAMTKGWGGKQGVTDFLTKPLQDQTVMQVLQPLARGSMPAMPAMRAPEPMASSPGGGDLAQRIAQALGRQLGQPADVAMKLFVGPELRKVGSFDGLSGADLNAVLQRLSLSIATGDGKGRAAFIEEARKLR